MKLFKYFTLTVLFGLICIACTTDDGTDLPLEEDEEVIDDIMLTDHVEAYEANLIDDSYTLAIENGGTIAYLLDKAGNQIKEWQFNANLGNDLELLPNGKLLGIFKAADPVFSFGGYGGIVKIINASGTTDWQFEYANENHIAHHDVELLPNGNVLIIVWEKIDIAQAQAHGVSTSGPIYPETLIEVSPLTDQIVWQWRSFDHLVQDVDDTALNFGSVSGNPQLIDFNYDVRDNGDIMHANGIDYDIENDIIYLSVNYYSEVWVIDHSTTSAEAASHSGGNFNKGGDLLYRFGNPSAYKNTAGTRLFYNNHFPNILEDGEPGAGNLLVYNNGTNNDQSVVYELDMPTNFNLMANIDNEPSIVWSFTDPELFHSRISGAVRLKNGNTLIAEGDYGFWEVTTSGEIAWKYNGLGPNFWRCYAYDLDDVELIDLNLE